MPTARLTGGLGVPLYTEIVVSGGDRRMRSNRLCVGPVPDYEVLSQWVGGDWNGDRRVAIPTLIAENGPGPDGSSLTAYYQRSWGCGTEKVIDHQHGVRATSSVPGTYSAKS